MATLIKKDQIATGEFIKNPLPEDPWTSTADTASLAAIAAKIVAAISGVGCTITEGYCYYDSNEAKYIASVDFETLKYGDVVVIGFSDGLGADSSFWYWHESALYQLSITTPMTYYNGMIVSGDTCVFLWSGDRGLLLLSRSSDGRNIFYGATNGVADTATKTVTLFRPAGVFVDGCLLILHFNSNVPAGNNNLIEIGNLTYGLAYHQHLITEAGVINAGDKVMMYCINSVAHIISIDRWGADIQGKQDALPDITNNAGKALVVNDGETGFVWKKLCYTYISHNVDAMMHDPLTLTCTEQTHHHVVMGSGVNGLNLIVDVHNNFENVITVDFTAARTDLAPSLFVTVYKDGNPVSKLASSCSSYGGNVEKMHYPSMPAVCYQLYKTSNNSVNHLYLKISAAALGAATYGIVHATPMLCSDSSSN